MTEIHGSCHCGQVRFRLARAPQEARTCNCSLCRRRNAIMATVPIEELTLDTPWEALSEYRWNTGVARHFFCPTCGIYTFHQRRSDPTQYGVNATCLEDFDIATLEISHGTGGPTMSVTEEAHRQGRSGPVLSD